MVAVNDEVGLVGVVMVPPVPERMVQSPVPTVGLLPTKFVVVPHMVWSRPAFATVGAPSTVIVPVAFTVPHPPVSGIV